MKFLLDENLSPLLAELLIDVGHDAVHVRDLGLSQSRDETLLDTARREGQVNTLEAAYAKLYTPPVVCDAVSQALDVFGEAGVFGDQMIEKLYRDVKILDIGEGTQQVQRLVVSRRLVDLPRDA